MKTKLLWTAAFALAAIGYLPAKAQPKRGVAQTTTALPPPPPPPGPPPDFIDDDTEFDDGDDLPENYAPRPQAGMPGTNNQQMPFPPPPAGGNIPPTPMNQQNPGRSAPLQPPPAQMAMPTYENDRPRFNGSKLHFKVVKDEFFEKGKKRERGKIEQQ